MGIGVGVGVGIRDGEAVGVGVSVGGATVDEATTGSSGAGGRDIVTRFSCRTAATSAAHTDSGGVDGAARVTRTSLLPAAVAETPAPQKAKATAVMARMMAIAAGASIRQPPASTPQYARMRGRRLQPALAHHAVAMVANAAGLGKYPRA